MKIVVLDGFTLNPGDLSWDALRALGPCEIYDRTAPGERLQRAAGAEVLLTNKVVVDAELLASLPDLRFICVLATGVNVVDLAAARLHGIPVSNVPVYGTRSVAQMTMALLLEMTQRVGSHAESVKNGQWSRSLDWCYWDAPLVELDGLSLGLVGFGRIGRCVAEAAHALGMGVAAYDPTVCQFPNFVRPMPLQELFATSDVVSLHCPLTEQTRETVDARSLSWMKPTAFLINTSRGPLVNEADLADALRRGMLAGAAMDVLSVEPPPPDNPLLSAPNCIVTPHIAWATGAARRRLMSVAVENAKAFIEGKPQNVVN